MDTDVCIACENNRKYNNMLLMIFNSLLKFSVFWTFKFKFFIIEEILRLKKSELLRSFVRYYFCSLRQLII